MEIHQDHIHDLSPRCKLIVKKVYDQVIELASLGEIPFTFKSNCVPNNMTINPGIGSFNSHSKVR